MAAGGGDNANLQAMLAAIQLQLNQMQQRLDRIVVNVDQIALEQRRVALNEIRIRNRFASSEARVRYPPGTDHVALGILAETISEAANISGEDAAEALGHLGLADPVNNIHRRTEFWRHIGILPF